MDTHKEMIAVAIADVLGGKARYYGEIANTPEAISKLLTQLCADGEALSFCYEAGPCGYGIYRQIIQLGHHYSVVPSP